MTKPLTPSDDAELLKQYGDWWKRQSMTKPPELSPEQYEVCRTVFERKKGDTWNVFEEEVATHMFAAGFAAGQQGKAPAPSLEEIIEGYGREQDSAPTSHLRSVADGYVSIKTDLPAANICPYKWYADTGMFMINGQEWKLVPVEPAPEMLDPLMDINRGDNTDCYRNAYRAYRKSLAATPLPKIPDFEEFPRQCCCTQDKHGQWTTACGKLFRLDNGSPSANGLRFCGYCAKPLIEVPFQD